MYSANPYIAGNPVGHTHAFVGREDLLQYVINSLKSQEQSGVTLYGQRRIGKTSILQHLVKELPKHGPFCPVFYDLLDKATWSLDKTLEDLARTIARELELPKPDLGADVQTAFCENWLPKEVLQKLLSGQVLVLLFDEFDVLADKEAETARSFFPYLRKLLNLNPAFLKLVFVLGRNVGELNTQALSLFKGVPYRQVSLLNRESTEKLVRLSELEYAHSMDWSPEAVELVWELTHGHTFLTQALCHEIWQRAHEADQEAVPRVVRENVAAAVDQALNSSRNALEWLWDGLGPAEKTVMLALAQGGPGQEVSQANLEKFLAENDVRILIRDLEDIPQLLIDWDLVEVAGDGYRIRVELLRRWMANSQTIGKVKNELDSSQPTAEGLFGAAEEYHAKKDDGMAEIMLRQTLRFDPRHLKAAQLLTDILLLTGKLDEAEKVLLPLSERYPLKIYPQLIDVYLRQVKEAPDDDARLALYEKVLKLDASHLEAQNGKDKINWRRRGREAEAKNDLAKAAEAYEKGDDTKSFRKVQQKIKAEQLDALFAEGYGAFKKGEWDRAITALQQVVGQNAGYKKGEDRAIDLLNQAINAKERKTWPVVLQLQRELQKYRQGVSIGMVVGVIALLMLTVWQPWKQAPLTPAATATTRAPTSTSSPASPTTQPTTTWTNAPEPSATPRPSDTPQPASATATSITQPAPQPGLPVGPGTAIPQPPAAIALENSASLTAWAKWPANLSASHDRLTLSFVENGQSLIAAAGTQNEVWARSASDGSVARKFTGHTAQVNDVAVSPDQSLVASVSEDKTVKIWRSKDGELVKEFFVYTPLHLVAFSFDGQYLAAATETKVWLWETSGWTPVNTLTLTSDIHCLAFSQNSHVLATGSKQVELWSVPSGAQSRAYTLPNTSQIVLLAFPKESDRLAAGAVGGLISINQLSAKRSLASFFNGTHQPSSMAFSPDGKFLVAGYYDQSMTIWDLSSNREVKTFEKLDGNPFGLAFSPDGRFLAIAFKNSIQLWAVNP